MKTTVPHKFISVFLLLFLAVAAPGLTPAMAQLSKQGLHAGFGIDGDTRSGYSKFGSFAAPGLSEDWFTTSKVPGVIDATKADSLRQQMQLQTTNLYFHQGMSLPHHSLVNNRIWIDAGYARDYASISGGDSTVFNGGAKNGMNPVLWSGRTGQVPGKVDILDGAIHFRRAGASLRDSLWMFAGLSTQFVEGDRHLDVELLRRGIDYDKTMGSFGSQGPDEGRTAWLFDAKGDVIRTGDIIASISYAPGSAPVIEVRIWVSRQSFQQIKPSRFIYSGQFDGGDLYGYASIRPRQASEMLGSGMANFSAPRVVGDSTYSTPWGSVNSRSEWSADFEQLQFVEFSLNLTTLGIDPALYPNLSACEYNFKSLFFKSRSSNSFTSALKDFVGPIHFKTHIAVVKEAPAIAWLTCTKTETTLTASEFLPFALYKWTSSDGKVLATNKISLKVRQAGTYTLTAYLAEGCEPIRQEIFVVRDDKAPPVATADVILNDQDQIQLIGGDATKSQLTASNLPSAGLTWQWKGPDGFKSKEQSPVVGGEWVYGAYYLTVTELRNGCEATATLDVSFGTNRQKALESELPAAAQYRLMERNGRLHLQGQAPEGGIYTLYAFTASGQQLVSMRVQLNPGLQEITLPLNPARQILFVLLERNGRKAFTGKVMF